nr:MFS transporter [Rarobacter faecitabidus]
MKRRACSFAQARLRGFAAFTLGSATAVYNLARQAYLTEITPPLRRARVLSTLGGFHRIGLFIGPFLGAAVIMLGSVQSVPWLGVACSGGTVILLALLGSEAGREGSSTVMDESAPAPRTTAGLSVWELAVRYRGMFARLGVAIMLVSAARGARQSVVPLWAEHLGLHESTTSLIVGIAGGLDMLLFYPAGKLMDRLGRLWVAVPSMTLMACATAAIPLTGTAVALGVVAAILGFANGVGSGIVMTLGADVAPPDNRARFLSLWRLCQDSGEAAGPLVLSAATALGSLAAGIWIAALAGAGAAGSLARWAPRYSPLANLRSRKSISAVP